MNAMQWKKFRGLVLAAAESKHTHRYRSTEFTATQAAVTSYQLLACDDDPDYDTGGDFSTPCECHPGSKITGIDLNLTIAPNGTSEIIEWMLWKDPDSILGATVSPADLFTNDLNSTNVVLRKAVLAYGMFRSTTSREANKIHVRVSRAAMGRNRVMKDGDRLRLTVLNTGGSATTKISAFGRIWTRI